MRVLVTAALRLRKVGPSVRIGPQKIMPLGRVSISLRCSRGDSDRLECGGSWWTGDLASPSFSEASTPVKNTS